MPEVSAQQLERLPLRVHSFLADVPIHDAWTVDLPRWRPGITLDAFLKAAGARPYKPAAVVCVLLNIRLLIGRIFQWDRELPETAWNTFASRLTAADQSKSLAPAGTRDGLFRVVYRFENEQLLEIVNRTVHGFLLSALVETADVYRFYLGVYVRSVNRFTPVYMSVIDPCRKFIMYPLLLRGLRVSWDQAFGAS